MKTTTSLTRTILRRTLTVLASAFCFGTSAFVAVSADDSEIYITKLPEAQTPNVLFAVDTSGSMRENVPGSSQSRMEAVKEALTDLINNTGNLKAGLSRFHPFVGSPIIFPVRDINKTIDNEEPFPETHTLVASIDQSTDDAEENLAAGTFSTNDQVLELTEVQEPVSGYGFVTPEEKCFMPKDSDDDDEHGSSGNEDINSPDLDIGSVDAGIRFWDVTIPRNAVILHAEIEFTPRTSGSGSASTRIRGHDVGNSPAFVNDPDSHTDAVRPRINDAATSASVSWSNIAAVSSSQEITTPNIRTIVQEIVEHSGWVNGHALTILFEEQQGNREFTSRDGDAFGDCHDDSVDIPKLRVTYVLEDEAAQFSRRPDGNGDDIWQADNVNDQEVDPDALPLVTADASAWNCPWWWPNCGVETEASTGIRFPDLDIPDGSNVLWADIELTSAADNDETLRSMRIRGVEESNPQPFNETSREPSDLDTTSSAILWDADTVIHDEEIFSPDGAGKFHTPNLADLANEIIADTGFTSGNHMAFIIDDAGSSGRNEQLACSSSAVLTSFDCPEGTGDKPNLRVFYELPTNLDTSHQQVGLRFNEVRIPQGAEITSAFLELVPETTSSQGGTMYIDIENNDNPETFSTANGISGRGGWTGSEEWTVDEWQEGERVTSVDISGLVSTVTNSNDWCGGQSLAFRIRDGEKLAAKSFESGSGNAPRLRVNYDTSNLQTGEGCTTTPFVANATDAIDNVFEESNGNVRNDQGELRVDDQRTVGLRFKDVAVPQGAEIIAARLTLTANDDQPDLTTVTIKAQAHANPPPFVLGATSDVTDRSLSSESVSWTIPADTWNQGESRTIDLADLVDNDAILQEIIDGETEGDQEWASGNALVLVLENASNRLDIEQCCGEGETPPKLVIDYRINLGDVIDPPAKELLLSAIAQIQPDGNTPLTDALYEGAAYFAGAPVHFGRTRGAGASYDGNSQNDDDITSTNINSNWDDNDILDYNGLTTGYANTRLSHPATYGGGASIERSWRCDENDPEDYDCRTEHINNSQAFDYISPFDEAEACERGFLVLLSDGLARDNSSRQLIRDLSGASSCSMDIPRLDEDSGEPMLPDGSDSFVSRDPTTYEQCGLELSDWLYNRDFIDDGTVDTDVRNNVRTFTIGFNLDLDRSADRNAVEYLQALAFVGSGGDLDDVDANPDLEYGDGFYPANTASELRNVFEQILDEIVQETTSFVAPGISVNAFNRLFNLDDIYFSLFRPGTTRGWKGNLKKFKLCTEVDDGTGTSCEFGEVIDANSQPAVLDDISDLETFGTLKTDALGFWSESSDRAPEIDEGGAGERIPPFDQRNVYVGLTDPADTEATSYVLTRINRSIHTGDTAPTDEDSFNVIKQALYDNGNCNDGGTLSDKNDCLDDLVKWLTGEKFENDDPRNGEESDDNRWAFGDPMHSRPLVITYGKHVDEDDNVTPLSKIFVGTNDGGFRMINDSGGHSAANDGVEEWIYYPYSMLQTQSQLKENPDGSHVYGIDDSPSPRVNDVDRDGIIEPSDGDFVHLYFGLRRGGRQIYAVDVTPSSQITGSNLMGQITPTLLWRIDGDSTPGFQQLGESWSSPQRARIVLDDGPRTVLIFGGGYSSGEQDGTDVSGADKYNSDVDGDNVGNAIYIVDASTGELLWWATNHDTDTDAVVDQTVVEEMNTSIAAPVTAVSTDGDDFVDHVYAVDLRGQVFRVDLKAEENEEELGAGVSILSDSTVGVLAELGDTDEADRRKFFYAPQVAPVIDHQVGGGTYNLISLVSGNRTRPQGKTVLDRAYALRDYLWGERIGPSNYPACNPLVCEGRKTGASGAEPINHDSGDLVDVTEESSFVIRKEDGTVESTEDALTAVNRSYGWYFNLEGADIFNDQESGLTGEKGFSAATVLDGKMFFTTFLPPETDDSGQVVANACSVPETLGTSRLYAVDVFTGAPVFADFSGESDVYEKTDRFRNLGAGPSANLVPAYLPGGTVIPVPTGAGAVVQDPGISEPFKKTFWTEDR